MKKPIEVIVRDENDRRRFCSPLSDAKIIGCVNYECAYSGLCKFQNEKMNIMEGYKRLILDLYG